MKILRQEQSATLAARKRTWPVGPWHHEPDKIEWRDEVTGLPCLIVRGSTGVLCGYVGVDRAHPLYGVEYDDPRVDTIAVHGGLTYANMCQGKICHAPLPGEPREVWWFGFDCGHACDVMPIMPMPMGQYRDVAYVEEQVTQLARVLAAWRAP